VYLRFVIKESSIMQLLALALPLMLASSIAAAHVPQYGQ